MWYSSRYGYHTNALLDLQTMAGLGIRADNPIEVTAKVIVFAALLCYAGGTFRLGNRPWSRSMNVRSVVHARQE